MGKRLACGGCALGLLFVFYLAVASVIHAFASARLAEEHSRQYRDGRRLSLDLQKYAETHHSRLPGLDWRSQIEELDPGIFSHIEREFEGQLIGYAALPDVLGKKLSGFDPAKIIFVQYHASRPLVVVSNPAEFGPSARSGRAAYILADGRVSQFNPESMMDELRKQGAFPKSR